MSADDQQFLDVLSSIPLHLRRYTDDVAGFVDKNVDRAADCVRETLSSATWLPDAIRPGPPTKPPAAAVVAAAAASRIERLQAMVWRHKVLTGVVVVVLGTAAYRGYCRNRCLNKPRRAKRARNGGRTEVVVIAGSPTLPLTKSLSLDLERRGFVVFVVCNAAEDENMVHAFSRPDIRPLGIDTTNPPRAGAAIERFAAYLQSAQSSGPAIKPNQLTLKSVILIPSLHYQTSPIATIPPSSFADLFNTHLLQPILTIQAFLPLLTSRLNPIGDRWVPPKVLVFTPSIISSINPPFHAPEATVCSALSAFTEVLTAELRPLDIPVTHMQLGTFDFSGFVPASRAAANPNARGPSSVVAHDTLAWPDTARHVYGRNYVAHANSAISGGRLHGCRGSSLRSLHYAVFDVIDGSVTRDSVRVGLGASVYGFVGRWAPRTFVSWIMGVRKVDELSAWKASPDEEAPAHDDVEAAAAAAAAETAVMSSSEFVAVTPERNVWRSETPESNLWGPSVTGSS